MELDESSRNRILERAAIVGIDRDILRSRFQHLLNPQETLKREHYIGGLNSYIDHTLLKATATRKDIISLCQDAMLHHFFAVCVNGCRVSQCVAALKSSEVRVAAVIGFPLGACSTDAKVAEAKHAISLGAGEIDMVINVGYLMDGDYEYVKRDIAAVVQAAEARVVKVIMETALISENQLIDGCLLAVAANATFVKTCTGFGGGGATAKDVQLMKAVVGNSAYVKASGGIKTAEDARAMIISGADRIGTSSGVAIVTGSNADKTVY